MSKNKRAGNAKKVGKAGSPPSGTKNEKPRDGKDKRESVAKVSKKDVGGGEPGGGLH
jgi:hypothetical protein